MRNQALAVFVLVGACGGSGSEGPDASTADAAPIAAPPTITIMGTVQEVAGLATQPAQNVTITALKASDESTPFQAGVTTGASGTYTLTLNTGGVAPNIIGRYSKAGKLNEWVYPGEPLTHDLSNIDGIMMSAADLNTFTIFFPTPDPTAGLVAVLVLDAQGMPAEGATVTLSPPPEVGEYAATNNYPSSTLSATSSKGIFYGWNEPVAGGGNTATVTVSGTYMGAPLKSHQMKVHKGEIALTLLHP